jgi:hypothetical protein
MKPIIRLSLLLGLAFFATGPAIAQTGQGQATPQQVPVAPQDQESGGSLSKQLNQTNGVIHPPADADQDAVKPTPPVGQQSTPVIPPPGTPGTNQNIEPK